MLQGSKSLLQTSKSLSKWARLANQQIALLTEERAHYAKLAVDFQAGIEAERQTLATIYDTVGWKILDRYRRCANPPNCSLCPTKC